MASRTLAIIEASAIYAAAIRQAEADLDAVVIPADAADDAEKIGAIVARADAACAAAQRAALAAYDAVVAAQRR